MTVATPAAPDLRRASIADLRRIDYRALSRDFWTDEAATWDRFRASWAGLDEAAWRLPGAAPSDAGGPDWSLQEHVGHVVDWHEIATSYLDRVLAGGPWPNDSDFDGGNFDAFNERGRARWAEVPAGEVRRRAQEAHGRALEVARRLPPEEIRRDDAWGWVYMVFHGHEMEHLAVIEPWAERLRARQVEGDPFLADPRPAGDGSSAGILGFWRAEAQVFELFDELIRSVPSDRWNETGPTREWTLKDHVGHLARWFEEGVEVIEEHARTGAWRGPADGLDAWNAREIAAARHLDPAQALDRFDRARGRLRAAASAMSRAQLASPEAGAWTYECLHGHVRAHLAMVGPWCARVGWPNEASPPN